MSRVQKGQAFVGLALSLISLLLAINGVPLLVLFFGAVLGLCAHFAFVNLTSSRGP